MFDLVLHASRPGLIKVWSSILAKANSVFDEAKLGRLTLITYRSLQIPTTIKASKFLYKSLISEKLLLLNKRQLQYDVN